jgi:hypothetical protein
MAVNAAILFIVLFVFEYVRVGAKGVLVSRKVEHAIRWGSKIQDRVLPWLGYTCSNG